MRKNQEDLLNGHSAPIWHAWRDRTGMPYAPVRLSYPDVYNIFDKPLHTITDAENFISTLTANKLYCFVADIMNTDNVPYVDELLDRSMRSEKPSVFPYVSRTGKIAAIRMSKSRRNGFLIPASTWKYSTGPDRRFIENIFYLFNLFGFQSTTPASLSEKVLRSTLSDDMHITRPSTIVRDTILKHNVGGRIDKAEYGAFFPVVVKYDKNKAYLYHSRLVPSPFQAPVTEIAPTLDQALSMPVGFWECELVCREQRIPAIQIDGRRPVEGEMIIRWLWSGELEDCLAAGYTLHKIRRGFSWRALSDFMCQWTDVLYGKYEYTQNEDPHIRDMIKSMMVGLPGRFLRQPEIYHLVNIREGLQDGDMPLDFLTRNKNGSYFSDYVVRAEYDNESTALSPIGSFIVAQMRREIYKKSIALEQEGLRVISTYVDCISVDGLSQSIPVSSALGDYKEQVYWNQYSEFNRFIAKKIYNGDKYTWEDDVRAPGMGEDGQERRNFWARYRQMVKDNVNP